MTDTDRRIIDATPADAGPAARIIAVAFEELLATAWLVPNAAERVPVTEAFMRLHVEDALQHGMVEMFSDGSGVAVWFPVEDGLPAVAEDYQRRLHEECGKYAARFERLEATFAENHPTGVAHHYLAFLAVRPEVQGQGLGTALLRHHASRCPGSPGYLEASSPESRALYARNGYLDLGEFSLPGPGGPTLWTMWRPASADVEH